MTWKHDSQSPVPSTGCNAEENDNSTVRSQCPIQRLLGDQRKFTYQSRRREGFQLPYRRRVKWQRKEKCERRA